MNLTPSVKLALAKFGTMLERTVKKFRNCAIVWQHAVLIG